MIDHTPLTTPSRYHTKTLRHNSATANRFKTSAKDTARQANFIRAYDKKNVGTGKTLTPYEYNGMTNAETTTANIFK
jgi:hypothetical protein